MPDGKLLMKQKGKPMRNLTVKETNRILSLTTAVVVNNSYVSMVLKKKNEYYMLSNEMEIFLKLDEMKNINANNDKLIFTDHAGTVTELMPLGPVVPMLVDA